MNFGRPIIGRRVFVRNGLRTAQAIGLRVGLWLRRKEIVIWVGFLESKQIFKIGWADNYFSLFSFISLYHV